MSGVAPIQRHQRNDEDIDFEEAEELRTVNGLIYDKVYEAAEKFAGTYVGQYATGKVDRILKLIEDTAKWSLPQSQEKQDSSIPLKRPLPWIPFIAMIVMLRMIRLSLSIGGLFIGNAPLVPGDVVYFIQTRRRKLRAIRIVGMRDIRRREQAKGQKQSGGIVSKLRSLLAVVVCRPGQGREVSKSLAINQNNLEGSSNTGGNEPNADKLLKPFKCRLAEDQDGSDHDLTLDQIIDKYGEASSDSDSDFLPSPEALNLEGVSSESTSSATSDDFDDDDDDNNEVKQSREDANMESDAHMTNGNKGSQVSSSFTENQPDDSSMVIKENGEHFNTESRRPVPMPKPVPTPIQEIKQEPIDSDEDRSSNQQHQQDPTELKKSTEQLQHQQQQSVVARSDEKVNVWDGPTDKSTEDGNVEKAEKKVNGDDHLPVIDHKSEVFLTPATSTEDLFFSPVGSPNLSDNFGFHPTSILKNPNAVHLEKRGPAITYTDDDNTVRAEERTETHATSKPISTSHQLPKGSSHYTGKHTKNKFRGKRR